MNHAPHIVPVTQLRHAHSPGRGYDDRNAPRDTPPRPRSRTEKRRLSNVVYRHLVADAIR